MNRDIHVRCRDCQSVYSIVRIKDTINAPLEYCIFCGGHSLAHGEEDSDYWLNLAVDLGLPKTPRSKEAMKALFDTWNPVDGDPDRFVDFARNMINGVSVS